MIGCYGHRKGQYFSFDAIVASVIFVLTLVMLFSYWYSVRTYLDFQSNDLNKEAARLSGLIFTPPNGDCQTSAGITRLGLSNSYDDNRINETVLECVSGMSEDALKANLSSAYNVSIVVTDMYATSGGSYILGTDPTGASFSAHTSEVSKLVRIGSIDSADGSSHLARVEIYVYR